MNYLVKYIVVPFIYLTFLFSKVHAGQADNLSFPEQSDKCLSPTKYYQKQHDNSDLYSLFNGCSKLLTYIKQSSFDDLALVFANPTLSTPMSYFGHTFLVFRKKESLNFSKVFSFSAITPENMPFLELFNKGIFGGLDGRYSFANFYDIKKEYLDKEQRSLVFYTLHFTAAEKDLLFLKAYELYNVQTTYSFFNKNCTTELLALLSFVKPELVPLMDKTKGYFQPSELVNLLMKQKLVSRVSHTLSPDLDKFNLSYFSKNTNDRQMIIDYINKDSELDYEDITDAMKSDISLISNIKFEYEKEPLLNFIEISDFRYKLPISPSFQPKVETKISQMAPNEIRYGYGYDFSNNTDFLVLGFKPSFISRDQVRISPTYSGTLNILDTELTFSNDSLFVSKFNFLEIESFAKNINIFSLNSWRFLLGTGNHLNTNDSNLKWDVDFAYGKTWGSDNFQVSLLPQLSYSWNQNTLQVELYSDVMWRTSLGSFNIKYVPNIIKDNDDKNTLTIKYQSRFFFSVNSFSIKYNDKPKVLELNLQHRF